MARNGMYGMFIDLAIALEHSCTYVDNDFTSVKTNFFTILLFLIDGVASRDPVVQKHQV